MKLKWESSLDETLSKAIIKAVGKNSTVEAIVQRISEEYNVGKEKVIKVLYLLQQAEVIHLEDPHPPSSIRGYTLSNYSLWFWMLVILAASTSAFIYVFPQTAPYIYLRYLFSSIFTLYLPGYTLTEILYPTKNEVTKFERIALSIGLSVTLLMIVGLVINYSPWGVKLTPVFTILTLLTMFLAVTALIRKFRHFQSQQLNSRC